MDPFQVLMETAFDLRLHLSLLRPLPVHVHRVTLLWVYSLIYNTKRAAWRVRAIRISDETKKMVKRVWI